MTRRTSVHTAMLHDTPNSRKHPLTSPLPYNSQTGWVHPSGEAGDKRDCKSPFGRHLVLR